MRSGLLAQELCHHLARAEVIAVFESSFYLRSGHAFVCVGEPAIGNGPLTLIADHAVSELRLRPGLLASISERAIIIGNSVRLTFDQCEPWRPPRWPVPPPHRALKEISGTLTSLIAAEAPVDGLARAPCWNERGAGETRLARIAHERIADFTSWLGDALDYPDHVSPATPAPAIAGLIGLGPGLTPSGDDFLVGALALLDALEKRSAHYALARAIVAAPRGLTSPLSDCLLRAAAAGHVGEHLYRAISALMNGAPDRAIAAIRSVGHSSGWDMLAGAAATLRIAAAGTSA